MTASPPLHFGWLLDAYGDPSPRIPVHLRAAGLTAHTAFIAQSGSGKSFALGRYLEEILSKTLARIIILDPNSDFVKISQPERRIWTDDKYRAWLAPEDTQEAF